MKDTTYVSLTYLMVIEKDKNETEEKFQERVEAYVVGAQEEARPLLGYANDVEIDYV